MSSKFRVRCVGINLFVAEEKGWIFWHSIYVKNTYDYTKGIIYCSEKEAYDDIKQYCKNKIKNKKIELARKKNIKNNKPKVYTEKDILNG